VLHIPLWATRSDASAQQAPENEKAYIEALGKRCSGAANQDGARLDEEYASAMRQLAAHYPDDLDAQTLLRTVSSIGIATTGIAQKGIPKKVLKKYWVC
jgi:hypothetical protein